MGFLTPSRQPVPPAEFVQLPFRDRIKILTTNWVDDGFGTPRALTLIYVLKMLGLYFALGLFITSQTTEFVELTSPSTWFDNIVVYQKLAIWLMLLEVIGLGGAFGPLCGHFMPFLGNIRYWLRPGTIRMAPWADKVPGTGGDERTPLDVLLYVGVLAALVYPLLSSAELVHNLPAGTGPQELVPAAAFLPILVLMPLMGLRDKVIFLAARSEQYLPIMLFSAIFGGLVLARGATSADFVNMVVVFKIVICIVWIGAGVSKLGLHFESVVPPMVSNSPGVPNIVKRAHYRDVANDDVRPSKLAWFMAHVNGTTVEVGIPLVLLFTANDTVATVAAVAMLIFHIYITSTFPMAVPLEWNVYFGYIAIVLWAGFGDGFDASVYNIFEFSEPLVLIPVFAMLLIWPIWGTLRPDQVSFLPGMRQYAGNWASGVWAMRPGVEERLNEIKCCETQLSQLKRMIGMPYEADDAEMTLQKVNGWRAMHSQGRGLHSVLYNHLDDIESRDIRDGEFVANTVVGWNFGEGHIHDERMVAAIQKRLDLQPGDLVVAYCESQPTPFIRSTPQEYRVIDAALGIVERGTWDVRDCVKEQPWLPNGPVPLDVTWTAPGFVRQETLTGAVGKRRADVAVDAPADVEVPQPASDQGWPA
ncbi:hypothetical protein J2X46_001364 [Nocardioides sp. BE266]|uniref:DUF3556 domain-containing protein n=1 Tax=Nocardioides sp. BE266 TaxID=2817725 RepID=UPI002867783B|nr:DUF3556 domain-containing protein [Nocardioides sp. BE266]MDR7252388.1 hypothetical protein [Nocardioides sp. BE266]